MKGRPPRKGATKARLATHPAGNENLEAQRGGLSLSLDPYYPTTLVLKQTRD